MQDVQSTIYPSMSLERYTSTHTISIKAFLTLAISITDTLEKIHHDRLIHKAINPQNIIITPSKDEKFSVQFINSQNILASVQAIQPNINLNHIPGNIYYISPEQTGRIAHSIDYRTDFYSLGIVLYEILCKHPPFTERDKITLLHNHIAKIPPLPRASNPDIPLIVEKIILKLLEKSPENRYQSSRGLKNDFQKCLRMLEINDMKDFELGEFDSPETLTISQKLYGRESQLQELSKHLFNTKPAQTPSIVLLTGMPGIGKTTLVEHLQKASTLQNGYFLSGQYNEDKNEGYDAFRQIIESLLVQLLGETDIKYWQTLIRNALSDNLPYITQIIPKLELYLFDKKDSKPSGSPYFLKDNEIQHRICNSFNEIILSVAQRLLQLKRPLTIFIDNFHWADNASLSLFEALLNHKNVCYFQLIIAFRLEALTPTHVCHKTITFMRENFTQTEFITLAPLSINDIYQMLVDTLKTPPNKTIILAETIYRQTQGIPLRIKTFLQSLSQKRILCYTANGWQWNINEVETGAEFLNNWMATAKKLTCDLLKTLACLGKKFNQQIPLDLGLFNKEDDTFKEILEADFLIQNGEEYSFSHDELYQKVLSSIKIDEKLSIHYNLGLKLHEIYDATPESEKTSSMLLNVVYHLNIGEKNVTDLSLRIQAAELNLKAGEYSRSIAAWDQALEYFQAGIKYLPANAWEKKSLYNLTYHLYKYCATTLTTLKDMLAAEEKFDFISQNAHDAEKAHIEAIKHGIYTAQFQQNKAAIAQSNCLKLCYLSIPTTENEITDTLKNRNSFLENRFDEKDIQTLNDAALQIFLSLIFNAYLTNQQHRFILYIQIASELSKQLPINNRSALISMWNAVASIIRENISDAIHYAESTVDLLQKNPESLEKTLIFIILGSIVWHFKKPLKESMATLKRGKNISLRTGNIIEGIFCDGNLLLQMLASDEPLGTMIEHHSSVAPLAHKIGLKSAAYIVDDCKNLLTALQGLSNETFFSEQELENQITLRKDWNADGYYLHFKLQEFYFLKRKTLSIHNFQKIIAMAEERLTHNPGYIFTIDHYFYKALILSWFYLTAASEDQPALLLSIQACQIKLKYFSDLCSPNFSHKYLLVSAEITRITGKLDEAMPLYYSAIKSAKENEFIRIEALACELYSNYYQQRQDEEQAQSYAKKAEHLYAIWGATAVSEALHTPSTSLQSYIDASSSFNSAIQSLRHKTPEEIIKDLIDTLLKFSSGQKVAFLLFKEDNALYLSAESSIEKTQFYNEPILFQNYSQQAMIFVQQTVQDKISKIKVWEKGSAFSLPIFLNNHLHSIIYIEHSTLPNAFSRSQEELLLTIGTQIAFFIENANLLQQLEKEQKEQNNMESFIARLCHEVRNILNAMVFNISQLKDKVKDSTLSNEKNSELMQYIKTIYKSATHLIELLNRELDLAKIANGKINLKSKVFDYKKLLESIIQICQAELDDKNIYIDFIAPFEKTILIGDDLRIYQILSNLIGNAAKFTPAGGHIYVKCEKPLPVDKKSNIEFQVCDTGCGMTEKEVKKLFEPFVQANDKVEEEFGGTGLGLSIVKKLAGAMQGDIQVSSTLGRGTTFTVNIWLANPTPEEIENFKKSILPTLSEAFLEKYSQSSLSILVVDDNETNRIIIIKLLTTFLKEKKIQFNITQARNGQEAVNAFFEKVKSGSSYELLFIDTHMPVKNGPTAIAEIREIEKQNSTLLPALIITVSANTLDTDIQKSLDSGSNYYLTKPVIKEDFENDLTLQLNKRMESKFPHKKIKFSDFFKSHISARDGEDKDRDEKRKKLF